MPNITIISTIKKAADTLFLVETIKRYEISENRLAVKPVTSLRSPRFGANGTS